MTAEGEEGEPGRPARARPKAGPKQGESPGRGPVLTERQRREAREARRKRRAGKHTRPRGNPLVAGIQATGREMARTASFLGELAMAALASLATLGSALADWLRRLGIALGAIGREALRALSVLARATGNLVESADRILTPSRAIVFVAFGSALFLGVSQFIDYRAVEIGRAGYTEVLDVVSAPRTDGRTPIDQHSVLLVGFAVLALAGTIAATAGRRWGGLIVAAAGLLSVAIGLLVDLPAGTDASDVAAAYSGAEAILLAGFWLQLAAGLGLAVCGTLLVSFPDATSRQSARSRRRRPVVAGEAR